MPSYYQGVAQNVTTPTLAFVTNATNATPIVITTSPPHGFFTGDTVVVEFVGGNTAANASQNNPWTITVVNATDFQLNGSVGNGAYTSGGYAFDTSLSPPFQIPSDADTFNAAAFNVGYQGLADRTQFLQQNMPVAKLLDSYSTQTSDDTWSSWTSGTTTSNTWTIAATPISFFLTAVCNSGDYFNITSNTSVGASGGDLAIGMGIKIPGVAANALQIIQGSASYVAASVIKEWTANTSYTVEVSGLTASVSAPVAGLQTVTGLSGMSSGMVGATLRIGSVFGPTADPNNTGYFTVTNYISATSVKIANAAGSSDANNGSIAWEGYNMTFDFYITIYGIGGTPTYDFYGHRATFIWHYRPIGL